MGNRTAILRSKKSYETGSTAAPISAVRFRHFDELGGEKLSPAFKHSAIRLQRHLPRVPLIIVFQTAKLRRGVQMFGATRLSADNRLIIMILQ